MEQVPRNENETMLGTDIDFASVNQAETLTSIAIAAKAHWGYDEDFIEQCREELTVTPGQIENPENIFVIRTADGEICGFALVKPVTDTIGNLDALFIRPDHIGHGYGTELLEAVKLLAAKRGYEKLVIDSDPNAAGFYEKIGATKTGEVKSESIPGRFLPQYEISL